MALSDFVKAKSKGSLLGHLKSAPDHATMMWRKDLLDAILTHDEALDWSGEEGFTGDHLDLDNIGTTTHAAIDTHVGDATIHFTEASIDHGSISGLGDDDHTQYILHSIADATNDFLVASGADTFARKTLGDTADLLETVLDHGSIQGLTDDDHTQYVLRSQWLQNGFPDPSEVGMDWDDGSLTLTIQPVGASFRYFYEGIEYTEAGSFTETITDNEGLWVIYIDGPSSITSVLNPSHAAVESVIENETIVAYVYWDATNNDGRLMGELHGSSMSPSTHRYLHEVFGARLISGCALGNMSVDGAGAADASAQFSITAGEMYDEDVEHEIDSIGQAVTKEVYYTDGSGYTRWVDAEATFPVYAIGGVIAYNNAGTMTAVANAKYVLYHVFATNIKTDANADYPCIMVPGIAEYATKTAAREAAYSEIQSIETGGWPVEETSEIATVIYQHLAAYSNGVEAIIVSTDTGDDYIDWRSSDISGSGGGSGTDDDAVHVNVPSEISAIALKAAPVGADMIVIEDSADSNNKKRVTVGTLPTAGAGEANTASNAGAGESVFYTKTGIDLEFNGIKSETNRIDVSLDAVTHDIELTLTEGNIDHGSVAGLGDDDHAQYLLADGTRGLSADWDAGSHKITAETLESDVAAGTAPLTVASTTLVSNLNADQVDGNDASDMDY